MVKRSSGDHGPLVLLPWLWRMLLIDTRYSPLDYSGLKRRPLDCELWDTVASASVLSDGNPSTGIAI